MTVEEMMERLGVRTIADVSRLLGIPYRTVQNWKLGLKTPSDWVMRLVEEKVESLANKKEEG